MLVGGIYKHSITQILTYTITNAVRIMYIISLVDGPQFYGLVAFLRIVTMIGLFRSNNRMVVFRGGSRTAGTSKMERFVIIVNGFQPLTIITERSILDAVASLDPPLIFSKTEKNIHVTAST